MEQVQILRIVIASPGDVQVERDIIEDVAAEINRGVAIDRRLRLEVIRWETDAYPGFHPDGPQGLIDPVLRVEESDILVGIFWKRFGTPVKGAKSGTEHEFRKAYAFWKEQGRPQIMVYFNQEPYTPQSAEETEQWSQVLKFRDDFPNEGLWWSYDGAHEFEKIFRNHLTQLIRSRKPLSALSLSDTDGSTEERMVKLVKGDEPSIPGDTNSKKDPVARRPRRWIIAASVLLAVMVLLIVWQWPTSTSPPPIKVAHLALDLATGDNQRKVPDEKGVIVLMAADVEQLDSLSGRAVFENPRVAANYPCAWLGQTATEDPWRAISRPGDCRFTMRIQGREVPLFLRLTIAEQSNLFTITIRPKQP